ncbi:hypothetical protein O9993_13710 [Vibrio lentus]|nr:hypothetical protein [Vibrio lentus]
MNLVTGRAYLAHRVFNWAAMFATPVFRLLISFLVCLPLFGIYVTSPLPKRSMYSFKVVNGVSVRFNTKVSTTIVDAAIRSR